MPPLSDRTNIEENKKYADYDAILISDAGHFLQLERPKEFNQALDKWVLELSHDAGDGRTTSGDPPH
jgi:pimeloyl-ACP methyl ester carboxylesterase